MQKLKEWFQKLFKKDGNQGFTLIEIVIVLAIAGLIFVIVFVAVSAAQASRRDTARKNDASRTLAAVNQFASNNNGNIPTAAQYNDASATGFRAQYMLAGGATWADPGTGTNYNVNTTLSGITAPTAGTMYYFPAQICGTGFTRTPGTARQFAVVTYQERGQGSCIDSR